MPAHRAAHICLVQRERDSVASDAHPFSQRQKPLYCSLWGRWRICPDPLDAERSVVPLTPFSMADKTDGPGDDTSLLTRPKSETQRPPMYKVLILNDDYTPMEFVIYVLERFFQKDREAATRIMLHVHQHGVGVCGVFTYEVAETKVAQVIETARRHQHPLQCTMEKD